MTNLTIITPLTRPHNLERIAQCLRVARDFFNVTWYIVHDCRSGSCDFPVPEFVTGRIDHVMSLDGDCAGHHQANVALNNIQEGLVWRCDDDNLPVDGFFRRLSELDYQFGTGIYLYLFGQIAKGRYDESDWPEGRVPPIPRVGKMDAAQFVFRREAIGHLRFLRNDYKADGHFVEALVERVGSWMTYKIVEPLTQYNALANDMTINEARNKMFPALPDTMSPAPRFSVITPLHSYGTAFIAEAWRSLEAQSETEWEWIIVENAGGRVPPEIAHDSRVRVINAPSGLGVGALKRLLCGNARAPIVVELDCDDLLAPDALFEIEAGLAHADFVYSDFAEFRDRTWQPGVPYRADCGWETYPLYFQGHLLVVHRAPPVTPQNIRKVDWAPNHVRAWRMDAYREVGGHAALQVGDDHDLICRFFLAGKRFLHIPACLYFYRLHENNTVASHNAAIRYQTELNYDKYCWRLAERSGRVWVGRDTSMKDQMKGGEWLFLRCPVADWNDRNKMPLLKGDFAVSRLEERGGEVLADLIRLGDSYQHYGELCGD